ncbi:beta-defensin 113 [Desmodus rotundus]|uniref:beta-defensin 113 n=1 Tax=Desmodus rotundus TaxID=9430 RepID=UPI0039E61F36
MKILCIFLIFVFTASCGPSVSQKKTRERTRERTKEIAERETECFLVRGVCKTSCNSWEYTYNYCNKKPCCVLRDYRKPNTKHVTTAAYTRAVSSSTTLHSTVL